MLDKYTHSNLVYYKHNGDGETYDLTKRFALLMQGEMTPKTINKHVTKLRVSFVVHSQNLATSLSHPNDLLCKNST